MPVRECTEPMGQLFYMTNAFFMELASRPTCTLSAIEQFAFNEYCHMHTEDVASLLKEQHPSTDLSFLATSKPHQEDTHPQGIQYVYGLKGLAKLLQCSVVTASRIKASGVLAKATHQIGRKIVFDANKVLELTNKRGGIHV